MKTLKQPLVKVNNVTVKFENLTALENINLEINKKDLIYLIGPNGAGKSTLTNVLTGLLKPTSGNVEINTKNVGYMPQLLNQKSNFPITVNEVIYTGFKKQRLYMRKSEKQLIQSWLDKMNISDLGNQLMSNLSGGQQQRVYLIRTLISEPELLIFDEPTSALDPSFRHIFDEIVEDLNKKGATIIIITHDINDSLKKGKIIYLDQKVEYYGNYSDYKNWEVPHHHD